MKISKMLSLVSILTIGANAFAEYRGQMVDVSAWRGETVYTEIADRHAFAAAELHGLDRDGIKIEIGTALPVSYREKAGGEKLLTRFDCLRMFKKGEKVKRDRRVNLYSRITVARDAKAGEYSFGPVKLRVVDRELPSPEKRKYFLDLWQHPWAVSRYFDVKPFSRAHYKAMEPVWKALAECGQKTLTVTLLDLPWNHQCYDGYMSMIERVKKNDGSWKFDYSVFDEYVEFGRKCGLGPDIACYTMCPWEFVVHWKTESGEIKSEKMLPGTPEFDNYWGDFLVDFAKHQKEKGWFEDTYIAMDERKPEDMKKIANLIQAKAPGMKIAMAGDGKPSEFGGILIHNFSQYLGRVPDDYLEEIEKRRAAGFKTSFYVCLFPERPNNLMSSVDDEGYWIGAYPVIFGFDGFLRWAANSWPCDPYKDASCSPFPSGDAFLIYPNGELSTRLVALRAGVIAAEKAMILKEEGLLKKELSDMKVHYHFKKAMKGEINLEHFRKEFEAMVNNPDLK